MNRKNLWMVGLVACIALWSATVVVADKSGEFERFVVFGDSLSDPGNAFVLLRTVEVPPFELIPDAPYARGGLHFTNGKTWVEQLAAELDAKRSTRPALLKPKVFSNYAVGGARARPAGVFDFSVQVNLFLSDSGGRAPSEALYVVYVGSNDVRDALSALTDDPNGDVSIGIIQAALGAIRENLLSLHAAGARTFLVPNVANLAQVPAVRLQGATAQGAATSFSTAFNDGLELLLKGLEQDPGVRIVRLDVFGIINEAVAAPAAARLREVEQPCITPQTKIRPFCAKPDDFLFWDGIHPTRAGHGIFAKQAAVELGVKDFHVAHKDD